MSGSLERLARNINDLLQELRVALAGVQILFGFLLSIVFTDTYRRASDVQHCAHLDGVDDRPGGLAAGCCSGSGKAQRSCGCPTGSRSPDWPAWLWR